MNREVIGQRLHTLNIPVAYRQFKDKPTVPFIAYLIPERSRHGADDINLLETHSFRVELYCNSKNEELEDQILDLFSEYDIDVSETYIEDQELYMIIFEFEETVKITGG